MSRQRRFGDRRLLPLVGVVSMLAVGAGDALAQEAASAETSDEIVVTAQKREQAINDVGMSINALSASDLEDRGVGRAEDLARVVPGFTFTRTQFDEPVYSLRGVGYVESSLAANPAVSVYVDEVPLPYPSMTRGALLDLQRVEVLKGPQGTLFGQNSTGGAVNYIAARPTDTFEAGIEGSYARFDAVDANGFVSGPLAPGLNARLALATSQGGAWQRSQTRGEELGDRDEVVGRLLFELQPTDDVRISLNLNGWRDQSESQAPQHRGVSLAVPFNPIPPAFLTAPVAPDDARLADWDANVDFARDTDFYQAALRADFGLGGDTTLTTISSFQRLDRDAPNEVDGTPVQDLFINTRGNVESFYQELRLSGERSSVHWVVGANYQRDSINDTQAIQFDAATSSYVGPFHFPAFTNVSSNEVETWAVFGGGEINLRQDLSLELGVRYTSSDNDYVSCTKDAGDGSLATTFAFLQGLFSSTFTSSPVAGGCVTFVDSDFNVGAYGQTLSEDNVSWRAGLNWHASDDVLVYGNVSRGFKAGNFPTLSASSFTQLFSVRQEELTAYEVGAKATLPTLASQLNVSAFYYDYVDKQLRGRVQDPIFGQLEALLNIPESHVAGAELQWMWRPVHGLLTNLGVTYVDTQIDGSFVNFTQFGATVDFGGNRFPYTPEWQASADISYTRESPWSGADWFVGASATYHSDTNGGLEDDARLAIDGYTLVDLRAGLEAQDGAFRVTLWGRNVTDEYYIVNVLKAQDNVIAYAGAPASFGLTLSHRF